MEQMIGELEAENMALKILSQNAKLVNRTIASEANCTRTWF
jgi:hypothetical protein